MRAVRTILSACALALTIPATAGTLSPELRRAMDRAEPGELLPIVVLMDAFPERNALLEEVRGMGRERRRAHVVATMKALASRSQQSAREIAGGNVRVLWGVNGFALDAEPRTIERLAALEDVKWVLHDGGRGEPAVGGEPERTGPTGGDASGPNPDATIRGELTAMGAPQVWNDLGYTGAGVIVAVLDTGVYRSHPDLADHIWTNLDEVPANGLDDDANGYVDDTWGWDLCNDDNEPTSGSHGTQVAGQVAGDGTNGVVTGMAPDAELMVLGFDCSPPDSIGWEASDYAIANGAHVITESFIWPWEDPPDYEGWRRQSDTELAAGILHLNAAGNDGQNQVNRPIPYNVAAPANCPPPWLHPDQAIAGGISSVVAVANVSWTTDLLEPSSSRGPSAWEDIRAWSNPLYPFPLTAEYMDYPHHDGALQGLLKPDLAAYGNGTSTTCPGTGYCSFSGTSSATPHVAGAVALMLQANPEATPEQLAEALMTTAQHRGNPGKNLDYGAGLLQAHAAVLAVESGVVHGGHAFDDTALGNGDLSLDPGEQLVLSVTAESRTDVAIDGLHAILTTTTPGITIHDAVGSFPTLPARGTATTLAPHFSLSVDPSACAAVAVFDLEFRYGASVRRSTFSVRVGTERPLAGLDWDMESAAGWSADPGTATRGTFTREDPVGVAVTGGFSNPEDDTTPAPGVACWVTGSGGGNPNGNDVDGGSTFLYSPTFGAPHVLQMTLAYDRWYYDDSSSSDAFKAEISNDGGSTWTLLEQRVSPTGGWGRFSVDLMHVVPPSEDMRLRYTATDGGTDSVVEAAVDEVHVVGTWVDCQAYTPPATLRPNPVGNTVRVDKDAAGHVVLAWSAPPVDAGHGAATLYRITRAPAPNGPWTEVGSATSTRWVDVDALASPASDHYRVAAENAGGTE
ncbi:MAG TPA: S8 family serine peptidase [Candidatus Polarisedimenticolaceae bacterium]